MTKRKIVLDTETTGFNPNSGDKIIEIGCVEIIDSIVTHNHYHQYINPERDVPISAVRVHGITTDRVSREPKFAEIADDFLQFVRDDELVIHNAKFDMKFLYHELSLVGHKNELRSNVVTDTLMLAREQFPGASATLDALCKRFNISTAEREMHGALLDAKLLARVYIELMGGIHGRLNFDDHAQANTMENTIQKREIAIVHITEHEKCAHAKLMSMIADHET